MGRRADGNHRRARVERGLVWCLHASRTRLPRPCRRPYRERLGRRQAGDPVGVIEKAGADLHLSGTLKNATLVRTKSLGELDGVLDSGKADVIAATKTFLLDRAASRSGARVLDGRIFLEPIGMALPKGRNAIAAAYVATFVEDVKATGLVASAIERAGLRGVVVAPLK